VCGGAGEVEEEEESNKILYPVAFYNCKPLFLKTIIHP
jgi:hypothetical protein